jgi:integrase
MSTNNNINENPLALPESVTMLDGQVVDLTQNKWRLYIRVGLPTKICINWNLLRGLIFEDSSLPVMSDRAMFMAQIYLVERMKSYKTWTIKYCFAGFLAFEHWLAARPELQSTGRSFEWSDMTEDIFNDWCEDEYRTNRMGSFAWQIRSFYKWGSGSDLECSDFSESLARILNNIKLKNKSSGELVACRDNRRGPFTRDEVQLIHAACEDGKGNEHDRAVTWTLLDTAVRPEQLASIRNRDLHITCKATGESNGDENEETCRSYTIEVPINKQKGGKQVSRIIPVTQGCGQLLERLRKDDADPGSYLFWWISRNFKYQIGRALRNFFEDADLRSPNLPIENPPAEGPYLERMPVCPRRFRYAMATERIARGESPENVATALCHMDARSIGIYTDTSPTIAHDFQRATDRILLPLVERMEGKSKDSTPLWAHPAENMKIIISPEKDSHEANLIAREDKANSNIKNIAWVQNHHGRVPYNPERLEKVNILINELVEQARRKFDRIFPGQVFGSHLWSIAHLHERPCGTVKNKIGFTTLSSTMMNKRRFSANPADALPSCYAMVVKAWIVCDSRVSTGEMVNRVRAARYFWDFITTKQPHREESFHWYSICENDLLVFENYLHSYKTSLGGGMKPTTIRLMLSRLQCLIEFLSSRDICRRVDYVVQTPSPRKAAIQTIEGKRQAAYEKLPRPRVIEALAEIYHRITSVPRADFSDYVVILISAVAILILTGFRMTELLTLPYDCEVFERVPGRSPREPDSYRYGIKYWVEKIGIKTTRIKWISPTCESVVRAAVARIKNLTAEARHRAKVLESNPDLVPLPERYRKLSGLTTTQLSELLGDTKNRRIEKAIDLGLLHNLNINGQDFFSVQEIETYLLHHRVPHLYTIRRPDGTEQKLSESLFVIFNCQLNHHHQDICRLFVKPINAVLISNFLVSNFLGSERGNNYSVFKRFGLTEEQKNYYANSHSFRHWLHHIARKGGMPDHLIRRYFGRRNLHDLEDYSHFVPEEHEAYVPPELRFNVTRIPA